MQNQFHNFQNQSFRDLFRDITAKMPILTFVGIILTYIVTGALSVYFLPLPALYTIPAAIMIQFGRFAVVFNDFLNPIGPRSPWPPIIATVATVVSLIEYGYSVHDMQLESTWTDARYWSVYLFGGMLIFFGYILELNFIAKGAEGYGMTKGRVASNNVQDITRNVRNIAADVTDAVAPKQRPIIAGFSNNTSQRPNSVETSEVAPDSVTEIPSDVVREAIKKQQATLRSYRNKLLNGIGKPETAKAGIARATARITELEEML